MPSAYLLVSHGSRDPRPQVAMEQLADLIAQSQAQVELSNWAHTADEHSWGDSINQIYQSSTGGRLATPAKRKILVGTACLELSPVPLHQQIKEFADRALAVGCNCVQVVPLFLLAGVHVMEDIPAQIALAQQLVGQLKIELRPYLGTHFGLISLLANGMSATKAEAWILLAHGSRRAGSKEAVETIARQLNAVSAYWAVAPGLESRVKQLISAGYQKIRIMPYFLFPGGITDAIAQVVDQLKVQFPSVNLSLAEPLGASRKLADLILDLIEK